MTTLTWSRCPPRRTGSSAHDALQDCSSTIYQPPEYQLTTGTGIFDQDRASTDLRSWDLQATQCGRTCFNRLKQFRDLAIRYAKRVAYYQDELTTATIVLWLR